MIEIKVSELKRLSGSNTEIGIKNVLIGARNKLANGYAEKIKPSLSVKNCEIHPDFLSEVTISASMGNWVEAKFTKVCCQEFESSISFTTSTENE